MYDIFAGIYIIIYTSPMGSYGYNKVGFTKIGWGDPKKLDGFPVVL